MPWTESRPNLQTLVELEKTAPNFSFTYNANDIHRLSQTQVATIRHNLYQFSESTI